MDPLVEVAIEPDSQGDLPALEIALQALIAGDGALQAHTDVESGQIIIAGSSEHQLDLALIALRGTCMFNAGTHQVAYRETLTKTAVVEHFDRRHVDAGGRGAHVVLGFGPGLRGAGFRFIQDLGQAPDFVLSGVRTGLEDARKAGLVAGFPVIDFHATLGAAGWHDKSTEMDFALAARAAFRELRTKAAPILLEPIMRIEVVTPDEHSAEVIGDLNKRRGHIESTEAKGEGRFVVAAVPLSHLFGYTAQLQLITKGAGRCDMRFDQYEPTTAFDPPDGTFPPAVGMRA